MRSESSTIVMRNLTDRIRNELAACPYRLSSPDFLHKETAVVKTTTRGKVGNLPKPVVPYYVN